MKRNIHLEYSINKDFEISDLKKLKHGYSISHNCILE